MADRSQQPKLECDDLDFSKRIRFAEVLTTEYTEIETRRAKSGIVYPPPLEGRPQKLAGLSLSGGGVRSATFNLGVLQALAEKGKLKAFDYLSTVSGGGYVGGWWSAWLARDERKPDDDIFPPLEQTMNERDARRAALETDEDGGVVDRQQVKDSALTAGADPIHHLRLFSNFLTPRKGILSADTWRAINTTLRNIVLTWLILLPIILAAIMIGQTLFILAGDPKSLVTRLLYALAIPLLLLAGTFTAVSVWILATRRLETLGDALAVILSGIVFVTLTAVLLEILGAAVPFEIGVLSVGIIIAIAALTLLWIIYIFVRLFWWHFTAKQKKHDADYWRNRLVLIQTKTLAYFALTTVVLLFAGFGHRIFEFLLHGVGHAVAKAGGWSAFAMALLSAAYTAYKASPTGGADAKQKSEPGLLQKIAFAVAPGLFLLVMGIVLAWVGYTLYQKVSDDILDVIFVSRGALVGAALFLGFALYEFRPRPPWLVLIPIIAVWLASLFAATGYEWPQKYLSLLSVGVLGVLSVILVIRAIVRRRKWIVGYAVLLAAASFLFWRHSTGSVHFFGPHLAQVVIAGAFGTLVLLLLELAQGKGANTRCIALAVISCTIFVSIGASATTGNRSVLTMIALISVILGWVLSLGWLADPNSLTLHAFYKARLVRAYLGASNAVRAQSVDSDITDAVPGDDVLLVDLKNVERGAPYHLVNTMLNLVGGSDLATQARASESFLMSKRFCGSVRTGFRKTEEYACGSISLGTAVAVSGAAVSPEMGAQTPSAAVSALLTLFNVRIGYWAPTPNLSYWRSGSTRLWPVYTLQELISQTTDLLPYCYLTDGGHYENTGAYSLIQRGCSLIVIGECGADPEAMFEDMGNLIRKVRIDFKAEIRGLDIDKLRTSPPTERVIVGTVEYGAQHAKDLGLTDKELVGTIIVIKPNRAPGEMPPYDVPVDVQQYGFYNKDFPQQQTFDLFYDEAQFESYRRLGYVSGLKAVEKWEQSVT